MQRTANLINALGTIVFALSVIASFFQLGYDLSDVGTPPAIIDFIHSITETQVSDTAATPAITVTEGCTDMSFNPCADLDTSHIDYDPRDANLDGHLGDIELGA